MSDDCGFTNGQIHEMLRRRNETHARAKRTEVAEARAAELETEMKTRRITGMETAFPKADGGETKNVWHRHRHAGP